MGNYYDLTGADSACHVVDKEFVVFIDNQVLSFDEPVFAASIVVNQLTSGIPITLENSIDWQVRLSDQDTDAMSEGKLESNSFTSALVKSITMKKSTGGTPFTVSISYQSFIKPYASTDDPNGPMITPILLRRMIQDINYLLNSHNPITSVLGDSLSGIHLLAEDITGLNNDNLIEEELHTVNVPSNKQVIRPACGSFFTNDLTLTQVTGNVSLVEGVDYRLIGPNLAKQAISQNSNKIFDYILIIRPIVGNVKITYRAFGGMIMPSDVNSLRDVLNSVVMFLSSSAMGISNDSPIIASLIQRIENLEELERHYLASAFTIHPGDTSLHWYDIAYLYDTGWVDGNVSVADIGQFRIQALTTGWAYDFTIAGNVNRSTAPLTVHVLAGQDRNVQTDFVDYSRLTNRIVPQLRLIWKTDGTTTGAILQLGIALRGSNSGEDVIKITNKSSSASRWKLFSYKYETVSAKDTTTTLPNGSTWVLATDSHDTRVVTPPDGFLAYAGNMPMTVLYNSGNFNYYGGYASLSDVTKIVKIKFHIFDRITGQMITVVDRCAYATSTGAMTGTVMFFTPDLCAISYVIGSDMSITLTSILGSHSINNNRFDLRQISFLFE